MLFFTILTFLCSMALSKELYQQCGGENYDGSTKCDTAYPTCLAKDQYYAQCVYSCANTDWTCKNQSSIIWQNGDWAYGCEFPQRQLATLQTTSSQCKTQCINKNGCTHYTWSNNNGGTCSMKFGQVSKNFAFATNDLTMICGLVAKVPQPIKWDSISTAQACDFIGNDLTSVKVAANQCLAKCATTSGCTHYTWTNINGGTCWMKSGSVSKSDAIFTNNYSMTCGITEKIQWNIGDWANACDFIGNDIGSVKGTSASCRTSCINNNDCTHYTWSNGNCLMKYGEVKRADATFINDYSIECGIPTVNLYGQCGGGNYLGSPVCKPVYSYCFIQDKYYSQCLSSCNPDDSKTKGWLCKIIDWQPGNFANNCDFPGDDFMNKASARTDCGQLCSDTKGCTHYTWTNYNGGICLMKKNSLISKIDAVVLNNYNALCGVISVKKNLNCIGVDIVNTAAASSFDWRTSGGVTPVKDQKDCNSCWAFAALGAIESQYLIRKKTNLSLSVQNIIDCNEDFECGSGFSESAFIYAIKNGIKLENTYKYTGTKGCCRNDGKEIAGKISEFNMIDFDEIKMKYAVSNIGPIFVFLNIDMLKKYPGGIFNDENCSVESNHAALAVGYGTDTATGLDYWIVKNSWGTSWGEGGYLRIARNKNMCGIGYLAMYPILETLPTECQCDGINHVGPNNCNPNDNCQFRNDYYAQCLSSSLVCPSDWSCKKPDLFEPDYYEDSVSLYDQCAGYDMAISPCQQGSCYMQNKYYSQCLLECPLGWQCKTSIPTVLTLWKSKDQEIYFKKKNENLWQEIQNGVVRFEHTQNKISNDVVSTYDDSRDIQLELSAVDCKLTDSNEAIYYGSWLSTFVEAIGEFKIWKTDKDQGDPKGTDFYVLSKENFKGSNSKNWIKFKKGNVIDYTFVSSNKDTVTLSDPATSKLYTLNSTTMVQDKSDIIFYGKWTSFCPGISIYGPTPTLNNTKATTTKPKTVTFKAG